MRAIHWPNGNRRTSIIFEACSFSKNRRVPGNRMWGLSSSTIRCGACLTNPTTGFCEGTMRRRTFSCDVPGCAVFATERIWGDGFPGWGVLEGIGITDDATQQTVDSAAVLCPKHLAAVKKMLTEGA